MRDQSSHFNPKMAIPPQAVLTNANTPYVSSIISVAGFDSLTFVILSGVNTDTNATFTALVEEGDSPTLTDAVPVADIDLAGTEALASFTAANDDNKCFKIGYIGNRSYVRLTVTPAANDAGNAFVAAVAILGNPRIKPTANPPT